MILRKFNAWLSILITLMLLCHAAFNAVWMISRGAVQKSVTCMPLILFGLMLLHAFICIAFGFLGHKGAEKIKCNGYPAMNRPTYFQRIGGVLLIPLTVLHILGTLGILTPPHIVHAILPPLFFAICLMHVAVSASKAFITLGIGNAKFIKITDIVIKLICIAILIADVTGFYLFLV